MVQRSTKRMEMVVDIYESADAVRGHDHDPESGDTKTDPDTATHTGFSTTGGRCYRVTVVCVVLLCVLLLSAVTLLWIKYNNLYTENNQLQTSNNNLTIERNQLHTCCNKPSKEKEQCRSDYMSGWSFSSSSLYYISTEKKTWTESRENCRETGADLVIITSREEQNFIIKQLGDSKEAWIGLSKDDTKTKWKWLDGTELTSSTGVWAKGEPNNSGGNEDCGTIKTYSGMTGWNDKPCFNTSQWICKKNRF